MIPNIADPTPTHDDWNYLARGEIPTQRLDRNYGELLQEVRVAQTGVQFLLAFLLTLAFMPRFATVSDFQRGVYVAALLLGAVASALLIAPAPFHRLLFRRRLKRTLVSAASMFTLCGLMFLMLSLVAALLLILDVVMGTVPAVWISGMVLAWFSTCWFLAPLYARYRTRGVVVPHGRGDPG
jgi:uncharacterized protein DUF6328